MIGKGEIMDNLTNTDAGTILDSLGDGVYVTDPERQILYWNKTAERITGWSSADMVGRFCFDEILSHVDKDGHPLCGKEYCPLHRSIVTGIGSECPLVFALGKDGRRVPVQVSVAPIRNSQGMVVGGVEVFRDISGSVRDLEKARTIQSISLQHDLPQDERIRFATHYIPHDIVGGDYYGIRRLDADRYGFFLADVMGHGVAAALYTMHLSSLWDRYHQLVQSPSAFAGKINQELSRIVQGGDAFAAGICGVINLSRHSVVFAGAGNPPALLIHEGEFEQQECPGLLWGLMEDACYGEVERMVQPGDSLLLFSDGAVEIHDAQSKILGTEGLISMLKAFGYPQKPLRIETIEEELLKYSNAVRLEDDLTFIEMRLLG
jgi:phosphoserine phosphatase RsbU/P